MSKRLSAEARQAIADQKWWKQFEHDGWKVMAFTDRDTAAFSRGGRWLDVEKRHFELFGITPQETGDADA